MPQCTRNVLSMLRWLQSSSHTPRLIIARLTDMYSAMSALFSHISHEGCGEQEVKMRGQGNRVSFLWNFHSFVTKFPVL